MQVPLCYPGERKHRMRTIAIDDAAQARWAYGDACGAKADSARPQGPPASSSGLRGPTADTAQEQPSAPWLPVMVYQAAWQAEPAREPIAQADAAWQLLRRDGAPVVQRDGGGAGIVAPSASQPAAAGPSGAAAGPGGALGRGAYTLTRWDGSHCPPMRDFCSEYYAVNPRTPEVLELAPSVAKRYARFKQASKRLRQAAAQQQQQPQQADQQPDGGGGR